MWPLSSRCSASPGLGKETSAVEVDGVVDSIWPFFGRIVMFSFKEIGLGGAPDRQEEFTPFLQS